jgi:hypothetical protein
MIPYRGIVVALGIATHDNVPKVVIISQGGSEPRDVHPWEASNFFSRDVIEKAKLIPFDQSRLEIKETARLNRDFELYSSYGNLREVIPRSRY